MNDCLSCGQYGMNQSKASVSTLSIQILVPNWFLHITMMEIQGRIQDLKLGVEVIIVLLLNDK